MKHSEYDIKDTAFFPLTGNPVGFHHLLVAECILSQFSEVKQIVFLLSNGQHPDPTKAKSIADKQIRLEVLRQAIDEFADSQSSFIAQIAEKLNVDLILNRQNTKISIAEFDQETPVTLQMHVRALREQARSDNSDLKIKLIIGEDLVQRMGDDNIFSDGDLNELATYCEFLIAPRDGHRVQTRVEEVKNKRAVHLESCEVPIRRLPVEFQPFLDLSSTLIRQLIQSKQHALTCFLPVKSSKILEAYKLYQQKPLNKEMDEWEYACWCYEKDLDQLAYQLKHILDDRSQRTLPHTIAFVETSTGGRIAVSLMSIAGVSKHFKESRIPYGQESKVKLLGEIENKNAVSQSMAENLAQALLQKTQVDFVLSETGMAGPPEGIRRSNKQGQTHIALASRAGVQYLHVKLNPFMSKKSHQLLFSIEALKWMIQLLNSPQ